MFDQLRLYFKAQRAIVSFRLSSATSAIRFRLGTGRMNGYRDGFWRSRTPGSPLCPIIGLRQALSIVVDSKCSFLKEGVILPHRLQKDLELRVSGILKNIFRQFDAQVNGGESEKSGTERVETRRIFRLTTVRASSLRVRDRSVRGR